MGAIVYGCMGHLQLGTDCLSQLIEQYLFSSIIFFCSLVQVVKQFWFVSDIQDMDFARFATIQNLYMHIIVKKNVHNLKMSFIIP